MLGALSRRYADRTIPLLSLRGFGEWVAGGPPERCCPSPAGDAPEHQQSEASATLPLFGENVSPAHDSVLVPGRQSVLVRVRCAGAASPRAPCRAEACRPGGPLCGPPRPCVHLAGVGILRNLHPSSRWADQYFPAFAVLIHGFVLENPFLFQPALRCPPALPPPLTGSYAGFQLTSASRVFAAFPRAFRRALTPLRHSLMCLLCYAFVPRYLCPPTRARQPCEGARGPRRELPQSRQPAAPRECLLNESMNGQVNESACGGDSRPRTRRFAVLPARTKLCLHVTGGLSSHVATRCPPGPPNHEGVNSACRKEGAIIHKEEQP